MIIIVHSETNEQSLESRLGLAEYSYYFVLKEFLPALGRLGRVVVVKQPERDVDPIFFEARDRGEGCVFLSFSPPNRTPLGLDCPTIPVFAWEFDAISSETWYCEKEQDWRFVLNKLGRAIVHSAHTVGTVQAQLGADFLAVSIPAPVWDRFAPYYKARAAIVPADTVISTAGEVVDTREYGSMFENSVKRQETDVVLDGVVYLSIFNPSDGRKNSFDLIGGFCEAFREVDDATLVLKLTHHAPANAVSSLKEILRRLMPFECRVVMLAGYLRTEVYERLVSCASYAVNASVGEGQCLPLMEPMSCGIPAVAPDHTGMADYINSGNAFVVESNDEPAAMPQDPRCAYRALRRRINFDSLVQAYRASYDVAKNEPVRYREMSVSAHESLRRHCSLAIIEDKLSRFLAQPERLPHSANDFGIVKVRQDVPWMREITSDTRVLELGSEVSRVSQIFARLSASVDVLCATQDRLEGVRAIAKRYAIELTTRIGDIGSMPAVIAGPYEFIVLDGGFRNRPSIKSDFELLREKLSPRGRILLVGEAAWRIDGVLEKSQPGGSGRRSAENQIVSAIGSAGFVWKRFSPEFYGPHISVYEFVRWTEPLCMADHILTPDEQAGWHGLEPHGRWTKADAFLEIPFHDGPIELSLQNHRHSRCVGRVALGRSIVKFNLGSGESRKIRFAGNQGGERLVIKSNVDRGGPNDDRLLGLYVVSISPLENINSVF